MKKRQMIGGGMRQAGLMAAAGIVALEKMIDRLEEDHEKAKILAEGLVELGFLIDMKTVQTNMVFFDVPASMIDPNTLVEKLKGKNVRIGSPKGNRIRVVMHKDVLKDDVFSVLQAFKEVVKDRT